MVHVSASRTLPSTPEAVWARIGDPAALEAWHPAIASSPVDGDVRTCTLRDGLVIVERILERRELGYTYAMTEAPLPVRGYVARLEVAARPEGGAVVTWSSSFEADAPGMDDVIRGVYDAGLAALAET